MKEAPFGIGWSWPTTIVIGAGNAGGIIASRLSEDASERVLLVESGPFYPSLADLPPALQDPYNPQLTGHDWGIDAHMLEPVGSRAKLPYPRGRLVGGSSAVNATMGQRGTPDDYDAWARTGLKGWGWDDVLPYFQRLESDKDFTDPAIHGIDGPVPLQRMPRERWPRVYRAFEEAAIGRGFASCPDFNAPGATGVGPVPRNQWDGVRISSLVGYVQAAARRPNLEVLDRTLVRRIVVMHGRATAVEVTRDGRHEVLAADRIVLCAGALKSPQLLMLSGIGPAADLESHGIDVVADLPGVGRNLLDHCYVPVVSAAIESDPQCGLLVELVYSSSSRFRNDMEIIPSLYAAESLNFSVPEGISKLLVLPPVLSKPESAGWLSLSDPDPESHPDIHMNFLSEEIDVTRMMTLTRLALEMLSQSPIAEEIHSVLFPSTADTEDDAALRMWLRSNVGTGYHACGTCKMGPDNDPAAVLDDTLRVRGIDGLTVADASVMPEIPAVATSLTCYMIGERAADLLRA